MPSEETAEKYSREKDRCSVGHIVKQTDSWRRREMETCGGNFVMYSVTRFTDSYGRRYRKLIASFRFD